MSYVTWIVLHDKKGGNIFRKLWIYLLVLSLLTFFAYPNIAVAGTVTAVSDVLTRLKVNTLSSHDITFTLSGSNTFAAGENMTIDFGEDDSKFTVNGAASVVGDFDFNDGTERTIYNVGGTTDCTGSSGANDISVGINDTTGIVTFLACPSFAASGAGVTVNIEYGTAASGTNRVTNPNPGTPPQTYVLDIGGSFGDSGKFAVVIVADEQIAVSATVDPTITLSLSGNSTAFGTLSSTSVTTSSPNITLTISTNAENGYTITVQDAGNTTNPGLYNSSAAFLIGSGDYSYSNSADLSSVAGYGAQCSSASATCSSPYNVSGNNVGGYELTAQNFATYNDVADNHTITVTNKAKVSGSTPAGSYNDTVTVIATGNF